MASDSARALLLRAADERDPTEAVRLIEGALAHLRAEASKWKASADVLDLLAIAHEPLTTRQCARALGLGVTEARERLNLALALGRVRRFGEGNGTTWGLRRAA